MCRKINYDHQTVVPPKSHDMFCSPDSRCSIFKTAFLGHILGGVVTLGGKGCSLRMCSVSTGTALPPYLKMSPKRWILGEAYQKMPLPSETKKIHTHKLWG